MGEIKASGTRIDAEDTPLLYKEQHLTKGLEAFTVRDASIARSEIAPIETSIDGS